MIPRKNFLPTNPKIIKKVSTAAGSPTMTHRSNQSDLRDINNTINSQANQQLINSLMKRQQSILRSLQDDLKTLLSENDVLEQSIKFYDNEKQLNSLRQQIEECKFEQQELIQKIQNCDRVQKTTTPEEYYLWQKKKKTEQFNLKIEEAFRDNHEQRNQLQETCSIYQDRINQEKAELTIIIEQLQKLRSSRQDSDIVQEIPQINVQELQKLKQDCQNLSGSIKFMKESNQILSRQLEERTESIAKHLQSSFLNRKSEIIKDLKNTKRQVEESDPQPPNSPKRQENWEAIFLEYQKKMAEIKKQLREKQFQEVEEIITPMDWKTLKWEQYCEPSQTLKETEGAFNAYQEKMKEYEQYGHKIELLEKQIMKTVTETMECQQTNIELQGTIQRILRLSMSGK